jgi:type VI secretion system secreted protein VgrG
VTGNGTKDANAAADSTDANALPKPFPEFSAPHIVLASAAGIATTATQSTHEHSAMHHAITAAKHISLSVGNSLLASVDGAIRFLAYHAGLRIMSVTGKMEVAALDKTIRISSALKIKQVGDTVHIEADEGVEINGGGSYSHFRDGVVEEGTAGEYVVHSNGVVKDGAQSLAVTPQVFPTPTGQGPYSGQLQLFKPDNRPYEGYRYRTFLNGVEVAQGSTDRQGKIAILHSETPQKIDVWKALWPESERITEDWQSKLDALAQSAARKGA